MANPWQRGGGAFVLWSILFGVAYTQAPLYYSNQNQYFLHGLAAAGDGDLREDWLANTKDPTPLFSALVAFTAKYLHAWFFYSYYLAMLGLYFVSLITLFPLLARSPISRTAWFLFIALMVLVHAGVLRLASARLLGVDYPWFLQAGLAGQYVLGFGLQPSVAGVFLITSIVAFLKNRPWQAIAWACLAGVLHATYLPTAALLTLAYMLAQFRFFPKRPAAPSSPLSPVLGGEGSGVRGDSVGEAKPPHPVPLPRVQGRGSKDEHVQTGKLESAKLESAMRESGKHASIFSPPYEGGAGGGHSAASGWRRAILIGMGALVLVMPSVIYSLVTFKPTSPGVFADAQHILAHVRIPHHAEVARWFDWVACVQILWIVFAIFLVRGSRLMLLMVVPFLGAVGLTLVQLATANDTLALMFPWRTSVILVPIATAVVLIKLAEFVRPWLDNHRRIANGFSIAVVAGCVLGGLAISYFGLGYQSNPDELPILHFVRAHRQPGDVYLIPVEIAKSKPGARGVTSSNFRPAPRRGKAGEFIAIDLQGFRLTTGSPIYIDFKSIPYQDEEVLAWYNRVQWCIDVYAEPSVSTEALRAKLIDKGITHVVVPSAKALPFSQLGRPLFEDEAYSLIPVADK